MYPALARWFAALLFSLLLTYVKDQTHPHGWGEALFRHIVNVVLFATLLDMLRVAFK